MAKVKFVAGRNVDDIKNFLSDAPTVIIDIGFRRENKSTGFGLIEKIQEGFKEEPEVLT